MKGVTVSGWITAWMWTALPTRGGTSSPCRRGCDWLSCDSRPLPSVDGSTGATVDDADVDVALSLSFTVVREEVEVRTDESLTAESPSHPENKEMMRSVWKKKTLSKRRECVAGCK